MEPGVIRELPLDARRPPSITLRLERVMVVLFRLPKEHARCRALPDVEHGLAATEVNGSFERPLV
jgi:hypothetical protein